MIKKILISIFLFLIFPNYSASSQNFKHGISFFDDLKYQENFTNFDYVSKKAKKGGILKLGVEGNFNSLNPFILKGIEASGLDYIYDSLMESSQDEISAKYGLIAKSAKIADDNYSITFILNENAKFSDGVKLTANDVVFTFKTLISQGHPSYKIAFKDVKNVVKINDYCVKFTFKTNKNKDLPFLLASLKILPKHFYKNRKFDETNLEFIVGSGPYKIKEIKPGKSITYERRKDYWAQNLPVNKFRYNFDEIKYDYYLDTNVMIEAFKAEEFDVRQENIARNWANSYNFDKVKNGEIIKEEIKHSLPAPMQTFVLNLRKDKFQDLNLRKALTYAFNFEWLQKNIFYGSYKRTNSYFANSDFAINLEKNPQLKLPISENNDFGRKNLLIAKSLLDKAGYKIVNQKLISPYTKNSVYIEFLISSKSFEMIIAPFVQNLEKLGIEAKVKFVEENQFQAKIRNFDYDIMVAVFPQNLIPGSELIRYFHSNQSQIQGSQNYSGLKNKEIDKIIEEIAKTKNKEKLVKLCQKFDKIMLENYYTIPQWYNDSYRILYNKKLKKPKIQPKYSLGFDSWWIEN